MRECGHLESDAEDETSHTFRMKLTAFVFSKTVLDLAPLVEEVWGHTCHANCVQHSGRDGGGGINDRRALESK